jgi:hypothetical protein
MWKLLRATFGEMRREGLCTSRSAGGTVGRAGVEGQTYGIINLLWWFPDWTPLFWRRAVFWNPVMRSRSNFANKWAPQILKWLGGGGGGLFGFMLYCIFPSDWTKKGVWCETGVWITTRKQNYTFEPLSVQFRVKCNGALHCPMSS